MIPHPSGPLPGERKLAEPGGVQHVFRTPNPASRQTRPQTSPPNRPTPSSGNQAANKWAIHDYENFGELRLDESEALSTIARIAAGIQEHGAAFAAYAAHVGTREIDGLEHFEDRYRGEWDSIEAYAEDLLDQLGVPEFVAGASDWLQPYLKVDTKGFARDLEVGGDVTITERPEGGVWVFSG